MSDSNDAFRAIGNAIPADKFLEICQVCFSSLDNLAFFGLIKDQNTTFSQFEKDYGDLELSASQFEALHAIAKNVDTDSIGQMMQANPAGLPVL